MTNVVSLHPYFKAHEGKLADFIALFPQLIEKTKTEERCYYYDFSVSGDEIHCREAYNGAEGVLAHLENVGELIGKALEVSDMTRLEVHGPADEIEKLKGPMGELNPQWFIHHSGV